MGVKRSSFGWHLLVANTKPGCGFLCVNFCVVTARGMEPFQDFGTET